MKNHRVRTKAALAATAVSLLATCSASGATKRATPLRGTWQQIINCLPTSYNPLNEQVHCVGSSSWSGTWTGTTSYTFDGTANLLTGDSSGTVHEVFTGKASDGTTGTLTFVETERVIGATSKIHIEATIVGASGGFAGSTGTAAFDGTDTLLTGSGSYAGTWFRPCACTPVANTNERVTQRHWRRAHRRH
jgi:hypothetical protein